MKDEELFICRIKECGLSFFAPIIKGVQKYLDKEYPGYKGFIRNASDGSYELFATKDIKKHSDDKNVPTLQA